MASTSRQLAAYAEYLVASIADLALTTTLPDNAVIVIQPAGDVEPVRIPGLALKAAIRRTEAQIQAIINATALSALQGMVTDGQIPDEIMRDAEFTAGAVRVLLGLSATEVNDLLTGATIAGQTLTFTQNDGSTVVITIPTAMAGTGDGVVQSGAFSGNNEELILTLDTGTPVVIDVPAALRAGAGVTEARVQQLINATSLSALQGMVTDGQIPASIFRDAELTAQAVRSVLNLTNNEVNNLFTGASISGQVITFQQNDGSTDTITLPAGTGGMADGVVSGASLNGTVLTLTVTGAADVTVDLATLAGGGGGVHTEQRVLDQDPLGSMNTFGKLQISPNGYVYSAIPDIQLGVLATGDFLPFDHAMYIGAFNGDPNPLSVPAGTYFFEIVGHKLRKTALNAFGQLRWQDAPWSEILPTGARYRGNHDGDDEALHHLTMDGDVYHNDAVAASRYPAGLQLRGRLRHAYRLRDQAAGVRR